MKQFSSLLAAGVLAAGTFLSGCTSVESTQRFNGVGLAGEEERARYLTHVEIPGWYIFGLPIIVGSAAGDGKTAIFKNTLTTENVVGLLTQELRRQGAVRAINVSVYSNEVPVVGSLLSKRILQATGTGVISRNEAVVQAGEAFDRSL